MDNCWSWSSIPISARWPCVESHNSISNSPWREKGAHYIRWECQGTVFLCGMQSASGEKKSCSIVAYMIHALGVFFLNVKCNVWGETNHVQCLKSFLIFMNTSNNAQNCFRIIWTMEWLANCWASEIIRAPEPTPNDRTQNKIQKKFTTQQQQQQEIKGNKPTAQI